LTLEINKLKVELAEHASHTDLLNDQVSNWLVAADNYAGRIYSGQHKATESVRPSICSFCFSDINVVVIN